MAKKTEFRIADKSESILHTPSEYEHTIVTLISSGNVEKVKELLPSNVVSLNGNTFVVGKLSDNNVRQVRYLVINGASVFTRAAIAGGVSQEEAFLKSDEFIYSVDSIDNTDLMAELLEKYLLSLTEAVRQIQRTAHNPIARRAIRYSLTYG